MAPSDREAQPQTAQSLLSGLEGGLCRAVPSRGGGRQPQTALPRVLAASWTPPQAPGKTGGCGGWWHSGQLALGCTWCPGHLRMPRLTCGSQDFRRQCSTIFFSFLSFQLQLTFCMNSHQFLVCGTVVRHLYTLRSDPPPDYSVPHPAPRVAAAVRTVFPCCASRPVAAAYGTVDFWPWDWEEFIEQKQGQKWLSSQSRCVQLRKNQGLLKHPPRSM